jgi:hypothetical protein
LISSAATIRARCRADNARHCRGGKLGRVLHRGDNPRPGSRELAYGGKADAAAGAGDQHPFPGAAHFPARLINR